MVVVTEPERILLARIAELEAAAMNDLWRGPDKSIMEADRKRIVELEGCLREASMPKWVCGATHQGTAGGNDPTDCNWPTCGCDPHATEVIKALQESGLLKQEWRVDRAEQDMRVAELEGWGTGDLALHIVLLEAALRKIADCSPLVGGEATIMRNIARDALSK